MYHYVEEDTRLILLHNIRCDCIEMADPNQAQLAALLALLGELSCESFELYIF